MIAALLLALLVSAPAYAMPEISLQETREALTDTVNRTDLYLTSRLNGQALGEPLGVNYSVFSQGRWPIYLYHSLDGVYHFGGNQNVGVEVSATQDLVHNVRVNPTDWYPIEPSFTVYDPQLWYRYNGLLQNGWMWMDTQLSLFPSFTRYSHNQSRLISTAFDTTWNLKTSDYRWRFSLSTRIKPTLYEQTQPPGGWEHFGEQRERLYFSFGNSLSYRLSDAFEITQSTLFDSAVYADANHTANHTDSSDDRAQLMLNYYTRGGQARLGAYFQGLVWTPAIATSTVGMEVSSNFLTARTY